MSSSSINIQLNIEYLARSSIFSATFNVYLNNQHSVQRWMSSKIIDNKRNIECLAQQAQQSTFSSTLNI